MRRGTVRVAAASAMAAVVLAGCSVAGSTASATHGHDTATLSSEAAVELLGPAEFEAAASGRVLINVHIPDEGSLPGTDLSMPYDEIGARADELPADRATPLAIYCMSGNMSQIAGRELSGLGYTDVVDLDGGMRAWQASGRTLLQAGS